MLSRNDLSRLATALGGLPVLGCLDGSPAAGAGVRYGDVLLAVDGVPTPSWDEFLEVRARCQGSMLARIFRDGVERDVHIELRPSTKSPLELIGELQEHGLMPVPVSSERGVQH